MMGGLDHLGKVLENLSGLIAVQWYLLGISVVYVVYRGETETKRS